MDLSLIGLKESDPDIKKKSKIDYNKHEFTDQEKLAIKKEVHMIKTKYPDYIPIVLRTKSKSNIQLNKIKYLVIQSETSLKGTNQTGNYDSQRLKEMIAVARKYKLISKEHNGDYIPVEVIKEKFSLGLDCINIAPEF